MYTDQYKEKNLKVEIATALQVWNRGAISLIDIRHILTPPKETVHRYRLPASAFLYTMGGVFDVLLDDTSYHANRFGLFHAGKGTELTIYHGDNWLEYYMVLYKVGEPPFQKVEYHTLLAQTNPFQQLYGFVPNNPIYFADELRKMYEKWKAPTPLNLLFGKMALYRFVYAVYEELEHGDVQVLQPDIVAMAKRYLDNSYSEPIVIQEICEILGVSYSYFYKKFKQQIGESPQEYLIHIRLAAAKERLQNSNMPIKMISESCGFADERGFYRLFTKYFGKSPNNFRKNSPLQGKDITIGNVHALPYNEKSQVRLGKLNTKGVTYMFKPFKSKAIIAAALSLMLLLSACSTTPKDLAQTVSPDKEISENMKEVGNTKTISTIMGDVNVPMKPQKVVVLDEAFGDVLSLGVIPIAVSDAWAIAGSPVEKPLEGITRVTDPEDVMAIEPDLILMTYGDDSDYQKYSKIAPTVKLSPQEQTTEERLHYLGDVLGLEREDVDKVLEEYNQHIQEARQRLKDADILGKTVTLMYGAEDSAGLVFENWKGAHALYSELGMTLTEKSQSLYESGGWYAELSIEVLPEYCGDYIVFYSLENPIEGNPIYESIDTVKAGRVIKADEYLVNYNDILCVMAQVDFLTDNLIAVTKK